MGQTTFYNTAQRRKRDYQYVQERKSNCKKRTRLLAAASVACTCNFSTHHKTRAGLHTTPTTRNAPRDILQQRTPAQTRLHPRTTRRHAHARVCLSQPVSRAQVSAYEGVRETHLGLQGKQRSGPHAGRSKTLQTRTHLLVAARTSKCLRSGVTPGSVRHL